MNDDGIIVSMDVMCELSSELTAYIVKSFTTIPLEELEVIAPNGDLIYSDRVQTIFNNVLDTVDDSLNM